MVRGMAPKKLEGPRTRRVAVMFDDAEIDAIDAARKGTGLDRATFIRLLVFRGIAAKEPS